MESKQCMSSKTRKYLWDGFFELMELELGPVGQVLLFFSLYFVLISRPQRRVRKHIILLPRDNHY